MPKKVSADLPVPDLLEDVLAFIYATEGKPNPKDRVLSLYNDEDMDEEEFDFEQEE